MVKKYFFQYITENLNDDLLTMLSGISAFAYLRLLTIWDKYVKIVSLKVYYVLDVYLSFDLYKIFIG